MTWYLHEIIAEVQPAYYDFLLQVLLWSYSTTTKLSDLYVLASKFVVDQHRLKYGRPTRLCKRWGAGEGRVGPKQLASKSNLSVITQNQNLWFVATQCIGMLKTVNDTFYVWYLLFLLKNLFHYFAPHCHVTLLTFSPEYANHFTKKHPKKPPNPTHLSM